jgi:hypothetical protein
MFPRCRTLAGLVWKSASVDCTLDPFHPNNNLAPESSYFYDMSVQWYPAPQLAIEILSRLM